MKITFFDFATLNYAGGCEKNFMNFGKWLKKRDHNVVFVTGSNKINNQYCHFVRIGDHKENLSNYDMKKKFGLEEYHTFDLRDLLFPTKNRKKIKKIFNESDVVYSKNEIFEILILRFIFKIDIEKIVYGFHTPIYYPVTKNLKSKIHNIIYNSPIYFRILGNSEMRFLVLENNTNEILKKYKKSESIVVIPNPLDTKKFYLKKYVKNRKFKIYFIGRMTEQKGIDILYKVILILSKKNIFNDLEFFFVGNGDQENLLMELSEKVHNCHFLGFQREVVKFYHDADLVIAPSRWEGMPYSILEAQSCGTPVITTKCTGCKDIIFHGKNGWISDIDDIGQLLKNISNAYLLWKNNFKKFKEMGNFARKNIVENYEEDMINKRIENFMVSK